MEWFLSFLSPAYYLETLNAVIIASLPILYSLYTFYIQKNEKLSLYLILLGALAIRLFIIQSDPYINDWDECYHALVAKNMITDPFKPMLYANPVLPYSHADWISNHIWVHKQPLFLWQMALSMKLFGVNEIALRLPSVIMSVIAVYMTYKIAEKIFQNIEVAYISAFLLALSYFHIELNAARYPTDHNDVAFSFYVTASIWAFINYTGSAKSLKWIVITGVLAGCAVLVKWLTGMLVFGGWFVYIMSSSIERKNISSYLHLIGSAIVAVIVFLPWQLYILNQFPVESRYEYEFNSRHLYEVIENHEGNIFYHFVQFGMLYGNFLIPSILIGFIVIFLNNGVHKRLMYVITSMSIAIVLFFSVVVTTKMPAYTYMIVAIVHIYAGLGIWLVMESFRKQKNTIYWSFFILFFTAMFVLKPWEMAAHRSEDNIHRNFKIRNTAIFKAMDDEKLKGTIVLNARFSQAIDFMFYKDVKAAYTWFPEKKTIDSLAAAGNKFVWMNQKNSYPPPSYFPEGSLVNIEHPELIEEKKW